MPQTNMFNNCRTPARAGTYRNDAASALPGLILSSLIVSVLLTVLGRAGWMSLI